MSWRTNNGKDRSHIDGIGNFLKGPNIRSSVSFVKSTSSYITVDPSGDDTGVTVSLNLGLPDTSGNILASTDAGVLYWKTDISGGEANGPANSVQMKNGTTTDSIGYSNFIFDGQTFTIDSSNLKLDMSSIAIGHQAGQTDQSDNAIAIGREAGRSNQDEDAIAIGRDAGENNQREFAIAIGYATGNNNQEVNAVAIGNYAGGIRQSNDAVAIGTTAGKTDQSANAIAIGREAGQNNQREHAIAIGNGAGKTNQSEKSIIINATGTPLDNSIASTCTIKPIREVAQTVDSSINLLMYDKSTGEITQNKDGVNLGAYDLTVQNMTIGLGNGNYDTNLAFGQGALSSITTGGVNNIGIGSASLTRCTTSHDNTAVGVGALEKLTTGGVGYGGGNTAIGTGSLLNYLGDYTTAVGYNSLSECENSYYNTAVGVGALKKINGNTTGFNTAIGYRAGQYHTDTGTHRTSGKNCCFIGNEAGHTSVNNLTNTIVLGNNLITKIECAVQVINGLSDERDKKEIETIPYGLNYINEINPVQFKWNMRDGGKIDIPEIGFTAQNLKKGQEKLNINIPNLVNEDDPNRLLVGQGYLIPILVKSVQELSQQLNDTNKKLEELTLKVNSL